MNAENDQHVEWVATVQIRIATLIASGDGGGDPRDEIARAIAERARYSSRDTTRADWIVRRSHVDRRENIGRTER